ncbi:unnamed protein product, partial [Mesorhabditis spiculigera]
MISNYLDILYTDTNLIFDRRFYSYVLPAVKSMGEPYTLRIKFTTDFWNPIQWKSGRLFGRPRPKSQHFS